VGGVPKAYQKGHQNRRVLRRERVAKFGAKEKTKKKDKSLREGKGVRKIPKFLKRQEPREVRNGGARGPKKGGKKSVRAIKKRHTGLKNKIEPYSFLTQAQRVLLNFGTNEKWLVGKT